MNKRRLIIFLVMLVAVVGFIATPVMAKTYSANIKFNTQKDIGSSNHLCASYDPKYSKSFYISIVPHYPYWNYVTKAEVKYVKKINGKNKYTTKTHKAKIEYFTSDWTKPRQKIVSSSILVHKIPKGWKPESAKVYYKKKIYNGKIIY